MTAHPRGASPGWGKVAATANSLAPVARARRGHLVAAVDVGGTTIKGALWDLTSGQQTRTIRAADASAGPAAVVCAIEDLVDDLLGTDDSLAVDALGIVVPGLIHERDGIAIWAENLRWRDLPLRDRLEQRFGLPVTLGKDSVAAGVAEFLLGAGRGSTHGMFIPIVERARSGNPVSKRIWRNACEALGAALIQATILLDLDTIVVGGGVSAAGDFLLEPVRNQLAKHFPWMDVPTVRLARLGSDSGVVGAAIIAWHRLGIPSAALATTADAWLP